MSLREENKQMSMIIPNLEELVPEDNHYRKLLKLVDFDVLTHPLKKRYSAFGRGGYPVSVGFKCLLVQAIQDLSDRQLEVHLRDSLSVKLFCGFGLTQATPDHLVIISTDAF
jgi:IS5 family transposase